jgi:hypothetical protein
MKLPSISPPLAALLAAQWLTVSASAEVSVGNCDITRQPASTMICPGSPVQLQVEFTGEPNVVRWLRDGALIATQDLPQGGVSTLTDTPLLLAADGTPREATYQAVVVCAGISHESDPATVSASAVSWGSYSTSLTGTARVVSSPGGGLPVVKFTEAGSAKIDLAGATSANLDFSPATVAALSNTEADGEILISTEASPARKGWDGTIKGSGRTEISLRKRPGRTKYSNITFRCDGPGGGPRVCFFNGTTMLAQFPCGKELELDSDDVISEVRCSNNTDAPLDVSYTLSAKADCLWSAPTRVTLVSPVTGQPISFTVTSVAYSAPVPAVSTGLGAGKVTFNDFSITRFPNSSTGPGNPPPPLLELASLQCDYEELLLDGVTYQTAAYCRPPCGPPPPDAAATSILSVTQRLRNCNPPPFNGPWDEPGLLVSPAPGLAADAVYGVTLTGAAMECEDLMLRLNPPPAPAPGGTCFALQSWSWGTSNGSTALTVQVEPSTVKLTSGGSAGYEMICDGGISSHDDWQVKFINKGTIKGNINIINASRACTVPVLPVGAGKAGFSDISFMRFPPNTPVAYVFNGKTVIVDCDTVECTRVVQGFTPQAHAALRLEACCLPPFEITGSLIAHRSHQWGDAILTTSQTSPGAIFRPSTGEGYALSSPRRLGFRPEPTAPRGITDASVPIITSPARVQGSRRIGPLPGNPEHGARAMVCDFADCAGFVLDFALDADPSVPLPPPAAARTCNIRAWGRVPGATVSEIRANLALADVPPEPDGGMSLTPSFLASSTYRLTLKNRGIVVFEQADMSGTACDGLPRAMRCKPCPPPDPDHPDTSIACSFSWGVSQTIHTRGVAGGAGATVLADEVVVSSNPGIGPVTFTNCAVQCSNVHDLTLQGLDLLHRDIKRGPRILMNATGTAQVSGGVDEDCDKIADLCDGWLFAGQPLLAMPASLGAGSSPPPASTAITHQVSIARSSAASTDDGVELLTGEAEMCSWSWGLSNSNSSGQGGGLGAGRIAATFDRPGGPQDWGLTVKRSFPIGCILRPDVPVESSFRCTIWDGGDGNGGCTPVGPDIITGTVPDISASGFPTGMGFKCEAARSAEPDIVRIIWPFPVLLTIGGQSHYGTMLDIAPRPTVPVGGGPITRLKVWQLMQGQSSTNMMRGIVVKPLKPRFSFGSLTPNVQRLAWTSPSAWPQVSSGGASGPLEFEPVSASAISVQPDGTRIFDKSYPPPDRFFMMLRDLGWGWPIPPPQG